MNSSKLFKLYQMVPSPWKVLDKLLFSGSLIENLPTFELKSLLTSYGISVGVFFDKRANKMTRKYLVAYHIAGSLIVYVSSIFYLTDLKIYDAEAITLGVIPIMMTSMKMAYAFIVYRLYDTLESILKFFIDDHNVSNPQTTGTDGCVRTKKWLILVTCALLGSHFLADVLFELKNEIQMNSFTKHPHVMKFFPMWCPFESTKMKFIMSLLQDLIVFPEIIIYCYGSLTAFLLILLMDAKYEALYGRLKSSSQRTFERIKTIDKNLEETASLKSKVARLRKIKTLEQERVNTINLFYEEFLSYVARFQQLQKIQLLQKKVMNCYCSVTYGFVLFLTIVFGFICAQAFSSSKLEVTWCIKMLIWFLVTAGIWLANCSIGDLFSKQNDSFAEEVYSMPWYNFSPKQRKTVFTLLTIIQKPIYLRALNLVNVTKEMFPNWLNTVYSYVQIMQTFQKLKYRNV